MAKKPVEIEDFGDVEMTAESRIMAEEAERRQQKKAAGATEEDDDDDFDLLGDDDEDDDDISKFYVSGDTSEEADDDDDTDEDGDEDDDPADRRVAAKDREKPDDKPKSKAQKRIEELAEKRRIAEKEAFDAQMKNVELERRLAALEAERQEAPAKTEVKPAPDPKDFAYGEVDSKYIDALVEHRLSVERAEFQEKQGTSEKQRKQQESVEHYKKRLAVISAEGKKKFGENYDKIVNTVDFPGDIARDILDSDQGVDISFYLAKNIGKLREMTTMSSTERAKAMGRLEERFSASASAGKKRTEAPSTPSRRGKTAPRRQSADEAKYGPDDQDAFDKALFSR